MKSVKRALLTSLFIFSCFLFYPTNHVDAKTVINGYVIDDKKPIAYETSGITATVIHNSRYGYPCEPWTSEEIVSSMPKNKKITRTLMWKQLYYMDQNVIEETTNLKFKPNEKLKVTWYLPSDYKKIKYKITYDPNDGSSSFKSKDKKETITKKYEGRSLITTVKRLSTRRTYDISNSTCRTLASFTRPGYIFKEWNTRKDGKGLTFEGGENYFGGYTDHTTLGLFDKKKNKNFTYNKSKSLYSATLYAIWEPMKYKIEFVDYIYGESDFSGGIWDETRANVISKTPSITFTLDDRYVKLPKSVYNNPHGEFLTWYLSGSKHYKDGTWRITETTYSHRDYDGCYEHENLEINEKIGQGRIMVLDAKKIFKSWGRVWTAESYREDSNYISDLVCFAVWKDKTGKLSEIYHKGNNFSKKNGEYAMASKDPLLWTDNSTYTKTEKGLRKNIDITVIYETSTAHYVTSAYPIIIGKKGDTYYYTYKVTFTNKTPGRPQQTFEYLTTYTSKELVMNK